jgi:hypothetical protein
MTFVLDQHNSCICKDKMSDFPELLQQNLDENNQTLKSAVNTLKLNVQALRSRATNEEKERGIIQDRLKENDALLESIAHFHWTMLHRILKLENEEKYRVDENHNIVG